MALRNPGEFCWFNILTPDPENARAFFGALLGWTYSWPMISVGEHRIGAIHDLYGPMTPKGTPPLIGQMIKVASADEAVAKVRAAGGKARDPFDIGPAGRMAVCHDPTGAEYDVWEGKGLPGTSVDPHAHGAPCHFELFTPSVEKARAHYETVFGWMPDASVCEGEPAGWATHFAVADVAASVAKARDLGADVLKNTEKMAHLRSPQGVPFWIRSPT